MDKIRDNKIMQQILKDSFGGIMYDVANQNKYDTTELLEEWNKLTEGEKAGYNGLINGAINFITNK